MIETIPFVLGGVSIIFIPILLIFICWFIFSCFRPEDWLNNHADNKQIIKQLGTMLSVLLVLDYIFLIRPAFA